MYVYIYICIDVYIYIYIYIYGCPLHSRPRRKTQSAVGLPNIRQLATRPTSSSTSRLKTSSREQKPPPQVNVFLPQLPLPASQR